MAGTILNWIPSVEKIAAPAGWGGELPPLFDLGETISLPKLEFPLEF
jgi:hypothetical protein